MRVATAMSAAGLALALNPPPAGAASGTETGFEDQNRIVRLFECSALSAEFERGRWEAYLRQGAAAGEAYFEAFKPSPGFRVVRGYPPVITRAERLPGSPGFRTGHVFTLVLDGTTRMIDEAAGVDRDNPCTTRESCKTLRETRRATAQTMYDERNCPELLK